MFIMHNVITYNKHLNCPSVRCMTEPVKPVMHDKNQIFYNFSNCIYVFVTFPASEATEIFRESLLEVPQQLLFDGPLSFPTFPKILIQQLMRQSKKLHSCPYLMNGLTENVAAHMYEVVRLCRLFWVTS